MERLEALLAGALCERWSFPGGRFIESVERHHAPARALALDAVHDLVRRARALNRQRRSAAPAAAALPRPSERLRSKPALFWLVSVRDPVASVFAAERDAYNVGVNSMLTQRCMEIVSRLETVPDRALADASGGAVGRRRPARVKEAVLALKDPACDVAGKDRWAAVACCVALDVGLVVETGGFADVVCWGAALAWLDAAGGFTRMERAEAERQVRAQAAALVTEPVPAMARLRGACASLRLAKPYKRSRSGMVADIQAALATPRPPPA